MNAVLDDFRVATADRSDPLDRLYHATLVHARRHASHRREAIVVNRDASSPYEPHRSEMQGLRRRHEHALRDIITEGAAAGRFTTDSPALGSFAIREMCVSIARWFRDEGPMTPDQVAREYGVRSEHCRRQPLLIRRARDQLGACSALGRAFGAARPWGRGPEPGRGQHLRLRHAYGFQEGLHGRAGQHPLEGRRGRLTRDFVGAALGNRTPDLRITSASL